MATATRPAEPAPSTSPAFEPYRLKVSLFEKIIDAGLLPDDARIELLDGVLVEMMTKSDPHDFGVDMLGARLGALLPADWIVREEKSVRLGRISRPEPDVTVVRGPRERYRKRGPATADVALLAEVADTSYARDRGPKWHLYAAARVPVYWIVNLNERRVEVYTRPAGRGNTARYDHCDLFGQNDAVPVLIAGTEVGRVAVADLLP